MSDRKETMARFCEDDPEDDDAVYAPDADTCTTCGGSGGGYPPFCCPLCRGTGRSRVHDQERIDHEAEIRRDMADDDELFKDRETISGGEIEEENHELRRTED